ncbi:hypothetical protein EHQ12_13340 [Leptospira gomenensis]|uniref:Hydrolase n=1 Tax=Leptospira gomenensis TaxID=2484974 RepID=A0A5F1Y601_9LEPT|nr:hypothetical protein [Leptospira gomenensis]TGK28095.1 hypothetical protein EHQ17_18625 [Leptospira gomenensis]TGK37049.1 hypothetical protein EHQ12_13340 [Leptospira gomenensis]TGK45685.1 hypothetical protein EHQ07_08350 [Leptospira gomenensis]TGK59624.1 hypothetical protein EHQ13_12560 [Leptospira gomenensis]
MTPFWKNTIAALVLLPVLFIFAVLFSGKPVSDEQYNSLPRKEYQILSAGYDRNAGNVLAIQPEWKLEDFSSEERFLKSLEAPIKQAQQKGLIKKNTLVVFPAHTGSFLYFLHSRRDVFQRSGLEEAFQVLRYELLLRRSIEKLSGEAENPVNGTARIYKRIFSNLARTYSVYLLAGSIVSDEAALETIFKDDKSERNLSEKENEWKEISVLFQPDGKVAKEILYRSPSENWKRYFDAFQGNVSFAKVPVESETTNSLVTVQFPFARFAIFYLETLKNEEFQERVKKTFVSRVVAIGETSSETFLKDWASKSNFESTVRIVPSGSYLDLNQGGGSYVKTRYGAPIPGVNSREPLILNLFL